MKPTFGTAPAPPSLAFSRSAVRGWTAGVYVDHSTLRYAYAPRRTSGQQLRACVPLPCEHAVLWGSGLTGGALHAPVVHTSRHASGARNSLLVGCVARLSIHAFSWKQTADGKGNPRAVRPARMAMAWHGRRQRAGAPGLFSVLVLE